MMVPNLKFPIIITTRKWLFCEAKRAFPPTWRVLECGKRVWKTQNNRPSASATSKAFGCRCPVFPVLAPACAAVRIGLLLSNLSRLTHILQAALGGSNCRVTRAPLSPRCTGTICSLVWESRRGQPRTRVLYPETARNLGGTNNRGKMASEDTSRLQPSSPQSSNLTYMRAQPRRPGKR